MVSDSAAAVDSTPEPMSAQAWQDDFPNTAQEAIGKQLVILHYSPSRSNRQYSRYRSMLPDSITTSEDNERRSSHTSSIRKGSVEQDSGNYSPSTLAGPDSAKKRRKLSSMAYEAEAAQGPPRAGPLGWTPSTSRGGSVESPSVPPKHSPGQVVANHDRSASRRPSPKHLLSIVEPPSNIKTFDGAYPSSEAQAFSTHDDDPEVVDLISSPSQPATAITPASSSKASPTKITLKFKQPWVQSHVPQHSRPQSLLQFRQPQAFSSLDADNNPYPSPYTSAGPEILNYDVAKAKKGTPLRPVLQGSKEEKYTSVLEHDLAITKTRMAKVNLKLQKLEGVEKENEVLKKKLERLAWIERQGLRPEPGIDVYGIAERAATDATSSYLWEDDGVLV